MISTLHAHVAEDEQPVQSSLHVFAAGADASTGDL